VKVFSLENAYGVEQAQVIKNTEGSKVVTVKGEMGIFHRGHSPRHVVEGIFQEPGRTFAFL
jgi:hypothetical protein